MIVTPPKPAGTCTATGGLSTGGTVTWSATLCCL
jgi:hypothetical protein